MSTGRILTDKETEAIIETYDSFTGGYTDIQLDTQIIPSLIQYMKDEYIEKETCGYIISQWSPLKHDERIEQIYNGSIPPIPAKTKLMTILNKEDYHNIEKAIEPQKHEGTIWETIDNHTRFVVNFKTCEIYQEKESRQKEGHPTITTVLKCVPKELIVYDTILLDQPRSFKITWESQLSTRPFTTAGEAGGATVKEIEEYLINAGWSSSPRLVGGAVSATINTFIKNGLAIVQKDIDNPGFYYDSEKDMIISIKKEVREPSQPELLEAVKVLNQLGEVFKNNTKLLSTVLKWGLLSIFSYAKKQVGKWMPWLYLKGSAGSGKTTLAKIILYLHGTPTPENNIGGSGFDTQARVGAKLSKSCDPLLVNEPAGAFNRYSVVEMIKVCVESITGRGKMIGGSYRQIPAFSPVVFTANQYLPEDDALLRRFYVLSFSYSMRKTEAEKKNFERKFNIDSPDRSPLRALHHLADAVICEIIANPAYLYDDWRECIDSILTLINADMDGALPEWLFTWQKSESLEDFDNTQTEDIRMFFNEQFNQARKKITFRDENGFITDHEIEGDSTSLDFEDINWNIINNRMFPWALPKISRNHTRYVCFTQGLRKAISEHVDFCSDLKSIGELLGWKYTNVKFGKSQAKMLKVNFSEFMEFLYPNLEWNDEVT